MNKKPQKMQKTFALLVGINDYPAPISKLGGCLKDINNIENYLKSTATDTAGKALKKGALTIQQYGNLQICRLEDAQATHSNITQGFQSFLRQASPSDIVWFHFSGHGAEQKTAEAFKMLEPNGKDQTLVCHKGPDSTEHLHLADKELAVLLHQVATTDEAGNAKASPHIVVSLDCCHSGSGTRDFEENPELKSRDLFSNLDTRGAEMQQGSIRTLASYANGFYEAQTKAGKRLEVPISKHVLLSACESVQLAGDLPSGGIFTSGLVKALKGAKGQINYADLFVKTRASVQQMRKNQLPQFEPIGNFDPYTRFLDGSALGNPDSFEILQENGKWFVKCGAIHGLSAATKNLEIQTRSAQATTVGKGIIVGVGAQKSEFQWEKETVTGAATDYQAIIPNFMATPIIVGLTGETKAIDNLKAVWDNTKSINWTEDESTKSDCLIEVIAKDGNYLIQDHQRNQIALTWEQSKENAAEFIMDSLIKMAKWERTLALNKAKSKITDWVDFEVGFLNKQQEVTPIKDSEYIIEASADNCFEMDGGALGAGFLPQITIKNTTQTIYSYLLHFRANYSINSDEGVVIYRPDEHTGNPTLPLTKAPLGWGLAGDDTEVTTWFKLIVTTEPLDHHQLLQSGLMGDREVMFKWNPTKVSEEWYSRVIKVRMVRK